MTTTTTNTEPAFRFRAGTRKTEELDFLERLEETIATSPFSHVERLMNFPLYTPRQDLTTFLVKNEIFKRVLNIHGSVVECGVLFGGGTMTFAQLSAIYEPTNHQRRVIGFDTFSGFNELASADAGSQSLEAEVGGFAVDSRSELEKCVSLHDQNRAVGHIPKVELVAGDATKTIPRYIEENPHLVVSLLYLDFDVYEPTKVALEHLVPRMPKGAIIAFDELNLKSWPGETVATLETLNLNDLRLERMPYGSTICFAEIE